MIRVTLDHARRLGYCGKGMRAFSDRHGFDWGVFKREGLTAEELERTGDAMAIKAAALAREEFEKGNQ